ncbi:MAG TPA: GNAT family N-acetyltransferase [Bacteroidales bacterium]|jgi:GNAT superfamily N-acetyltransferase|nr:MAG: hypothetical protein BWX51_00854 [Bacteroidetes bacterium ADurb.Bin012]HNQ59828.1 GNAT family N-acetyltransferase [Bacteroidales bacterium]HNU21417.1 GNAT family N-acetyltransferase [Bacteroidales bacterium]HNV16977.1 GNAT family N-acetyltransferase [Bacteroidales bacterium]HNZ79111.1 GNAT family N-acetyltransferase [Bacteroidales bacterium]
MISNNYERMLKLVDEVFATSSDPNQIRVTPEVMDRLKEMHPSTFAEYSDSNGPVAWIMIIPSTLELMNCFVKGEISENELFELTPSNISYEALYLCSALVLEEYRRQGIAKRLILQAVENIRQQFPIKALFVWPFTKEGELIAENIARKVSLPLYKRLENK